ncbi:MAG: type I glyceraldehyde-3-phosphate dehydrogenase [Minisyncoccales bacterium]
MTKIAINGLGRIGRPALKIIFENFSSLKIVAVNDLSDINNVAHLLKYDSIYGSWKKNEIEIKDNRIFISGQEIIFFNEKDPALLPWRDLGIDIVLECTGVFTDFEGAKKHLTAGAKKVIISAPSKNPESIPSIILGVNEKKLEAQKYDIFDMSSCTTNCLAPLIKILDENLTIEKVFFSTIHSYTNDQRILDLGHKDLRRARSASLNIIPTSTGAAKSIGNIFPHLKGKISGLAFRVPTPTVSLTDLVALVKKEAKKEEINEIFKEASENELKGILNVEKDPLVSSDFIRNPYSSIVDLSLTETIGNLIKVCSWYDNEWGYANRLAQFADFLGKKI